MNIMDGKQVSNGLLSFPPNEPQFAIKIWIRRCGQVVFQKALGWIF
jgi:hypothetical protein